jgi:hypothetical protein
MFQPAVPVAKVLEGVHNSEYVLPAIQREFVWKTDQIRALFDSLMRGYPIGAFLFWKVGTERAAQLRRARRLRSPVRARGDAEAGSDRRTLGVVTDHGGGMPRTHSSPTA